MQYRSLGRTALQVSPLCLGTMNFGLRTSEEDSFAIMDRALDAGINFFDTANVYGHKIEYGLTESIIGRWLAQGGRREKIVLATKVYGPMGEGPNDRGLSALNIRNACEESLRRLQTDHIDLYQMHHIDRSAPFEEVWQAMELLVQQGKVLYVGSSNFAGWHIAKAMLSAQKRNFLGLVSEQCKYSLAHRMVELEVLPACADFGLGVMPYSPLGGGLLGGAVTTPDESSRREAGGIRNQRTKLSSTIERWETFCAEKNHQPADVALAWLLANPVITAPIIGPRKMDQLEGALNALEVELTAEDLKTLDGIWPGPGGAAPEAWAW